MLGNIGVSTMMGLLLVATVAPARQQCLHGSDETAEQAARRRSALQATRAINTAQANQPGRANNHYLRHEELLTSPYTQGKGGGQSGLAQKLNFAPGEELLPGWELNLDVTTDGYWFMIKDKIDPCGFAYISNKAGLIYTAEPIR